MSEQQRAFVTTHTTIRLAVLKIAFISTEFPWKRRGAEGGGGTVEKRLYVKHGVCCSPQILFETFRVRTKYSTSLNRDESRNMSVVRGVTSLFPCDIIKM